MVLLGDIVFLLVAKDPDTLWDPLGGVLYRLATRRLGHRSDVRRLAFAVAVGRRSRRARRRDHRRPARGAWIIDANAVSSRSRAACVAVARARRCGGRDRRRARHALDEVTRTIVAHGHLLVLVRARRRRSALRTTKTSSRRSAA